MAFYIWDILSHGKGVQAPPALARPVGWMESGQSDMHLIFCRSPLHSAPMFLKIFSAGYTALGSGPIISPLRIPICRSVVWRRHDMRPPVNSTDIKRLHGRPLPFAGAGLHDRAAAGRLLERHAGGQHHEGRVNSAELFGSHNVHCSAMSIIC